MLKLGFGGLRGSLKNREDLRFLLIERFFADFGGMDLFVKEAHSQNLTGSASFVLVQSVSQFDCGLWQDRTADLPGKLAKKAPLIHRSGKG
jgi:hypothetical protein